MSHELPADPDDLNNSRSAWAAAALAAHCNMERNDSRLPTQMTPEEREELAGDVIGNILHWLDRHAPGQVIDKKNFLTGVLESYGEKTLSLTNGMS